MHDIPYIQKECIGPEITANMTRVCIEVAQNCGHLLLGLQILAGANENALAVAHYTDEGMINACAGELLRFRRKLNADKVAVFADIKKKHSSHAITADLSYTDLAHSAEFFLADGLFLTGSTTAKPANPAHLSDVKKASTLPIFIGSGVTLENVVQFLHADGLIIGSHFKKNGLWNEQLQENKVVSFMNRMRAINLTN